MCVKTQSSSCFVLVAFHQMASKRQRSNEPENPAPPAIHQFLKSVTFKQEPIAMASRISTVSDIRLYELRKQFEVKTVGFSCMLSARTLLSQTKRTSQLKTRDVDAIFRTITSCMSSVCHPYTKFIIMLHCVLLL